MHVSDIKRFLRCKRLYKLASEDKENRPFPFLNINIDINESLMKKLHIDQACVGQVNETNEDSFQKLKQCDWLFKGRFEYNDLRVRLPLMHKVDDKLYDLYFVSCSIYVNDDEFLNMSFCKYVLNNLGIEVRDIYLLYLNKDYVREDYLDDEALWLITDSFTKEKKCRKIKDYLNKIDINHDDILQQMKSYNGDEPLERKRCCSGKKRCVYYPVCFPERLIKEDNSILTLVSSKNKEKMYDEGILYLKDADINQIEGNRVQYAQIMADKLSGLYVDKLALKKWMANLKFPLSFIDFEWDLFPIPPYEKMKPLDVLLFQYSLHVYDGNNLKHYEYIGIKDDRLQLLESMLENIPKEGSILAYNATGAEKIRIKELSRYFPQYKEQLDSILNRIIDMALPFISGVVYDVRMRGNFTLKTLENMIDKQHSYKELEVGNGPQAVEIHRLMEASEGELRQCYYDQLYKYCGLDSYSLYELYLWLNKIVDR